MLMELKNNQLLDDVSNTFSIPLHILLVDTESTLCWAGYEFNYSGFEPEAPLEFRLLALSFFVTEACFLPGSKVEKSS